MLNLEGRTVLVTGGAGFIGSHLVEALSDGGAQVRVLDNLSTGSLVNLAHLEDRFDLVEADIRDSEAMDSAFRDVDLVFHQAAVVSVPLSVKDPVGSAEVNEMGTLKVLEAARVHGVRRVVLASSSAVYGNNPDLPKRESMAPEVLSPYAAQKLANELIAGLYWRLYGLETVCLRYFNVFGPRQDPSSPYSGVISIFMERAVGGGAPVIYGDGGQSRDFVYVEDVARANLMAASAAGAGGKIFNIGTGKSITVRRLWELIRGFAGLELPAVPAALREGDVRHSLADIGQAEECLGFLPRVELESGLRSTYDWYANHAGRA